jgi:uncharacterized YccA/Bax inhibitor family protein
MSTFKHPLFLAVLVIVGLYVFFAHVLNPPLPQSLLIQFMVICSVGVLLVVTFDNKTSETFFAPLLALFGAPEMAVLRIAAFACTVAGVGFLAYNNVKPTIVSPVELRTVHPGTSIKYESLWQNV